MSGRLGLAIASLLILIIFLILTGFDQRTHLFDLRFLQFETSLYFASIIVLGLGAFLMFLFFSALSPLRSRKISPKQLPLPDRVLTSGAVRSAEIALLAGDTERASTLLSQISSDHPELWMAKKLLGDAAVAEQDILKAEQLYQQSIRLSSGENQVPALLALASICEAEDRLEEAEVLYRKVYQLLPGAIEPLECLRSIAIRTEKWNQALGWHEILEREFSEDPVHMLD